MTVGFLLASFILVAPGCTCGGKAKKFRGRVVIPEPEAPVSEEPPPAAPPPAVAVAPPQTEEPEEAAPAPPPAIAPRPEEIGAWAPQDFANAVQANDDRVYEAVDSLVEAKPGNERVAKLLISLIEVPAVAQVVIPVNEEDEVRPAAAAPPRLLASVTEGLARNGSKTAVAALKDILRGKFRGRYDDRSQVRAVLQAIAKHRRKEYDPILLTILTNPERVRPTTEQYVPGSLPAAALQTEGFQLVQTIPAPEFRRKLARETIKPETLRSSRDLLIPLFEGPALENLPSQLLFYAESPIAEERRRFETHLRVRAERTLGQLLDLTTPNVVGTPDAMPRRDLVASAAGLWSPALVDAVSQSLGTLRIDAESLPQNRELLMLAANLPQEEVRAALLAAWQRSHVAAADVYEKTLTASSPFYDPGSLLVLKGMPHEEDPARRRNLGKLARSEMPKAREGNPSFERNWREKKSRYVWHDVIESHVRQWNERLLAAADWRERDARIALSPATTSGDDPFQAPSGSSSQREPPRTRPAPPPLSELIPFNLHTDAKPRAVYVSDWPEEFRGEIGDLLVSPLRVRYVRFEGSDKMTRLHGFYRRQLKEDASLIERGFWLESIDKDIGDGLMRSTDVRVRRTQEAPPVAKDASEELIVEILIVEGPRPGSLDKPVQVQNSTTTAGR